MRPQSSAKTLRPLTAGGLQGVSRDTENNKTLIRNRIEELAIQIPVFREKLEARKRILAREREILDDQVHLKDEIEELRVKLYDMNEAIIKSRLKKEDRGLEILDRLKAENAELESRCEYLLNEKHKFCQIGRENDEKLETLRNSLNSALTKLSEEERSEFEKIRSQIGDIDAQTTFTQRKISVMKEEINEIENNVRANPNIRKSVDLENMIKSLDNEHKRLEQELNIFSLPVSEQKDYILKFVKDLNARNSEMENLLKQVSSETKRTEEMALAVRADQRDRSEKYNMVANKKVELESVLIQAGEEKNRLDSLIKDLQTKILRTTERISKLKNDKETRPEIELLKSENEASAFTVTQLRIGLKERNRELKRLEDVENAYISEIASLSQNAAVYESKLAQLESVEKLKEQDELKSIELEERIRCLQADISSKQGELKQRERALDELRSQANGDPGRAKLLALQDKLSTITAEIETLNTRIVEAQLIPEKQELMRLLSKLRGKNGTN